MTNLEWIKQKDTILKEILTCTQGVYNGTPKRCSEISCSDCNFYSFNNCAQAREDWLESTHKSQYKQGDVVVTHDGRFWTIQYDGDDELCIAEATPNAYPQENLVVCTIAESQQK